MIDGTATFRVRPEAVERCLGAIREFVDHVEKNEPRTKLYALWRDRDDPTRFIHLMVFEDQAAEQTHSSSGAVKRFTDVLYPETVDGVTFRGFDLVAGTGL